MLPIFVNERDIEPTVKKKANHFVSSKFSDIQLVAMLNFVGGVTTLDSFLKTYKTNDSKRFFPLRMFRFCREIEQKGPSNVNSFLCATVTPLKNYKDFENVIQSGLSREQVLAKLERATYPIYWSGEIRLFPEYLG